MATEIKTWEIVDEQLKLVNTRLSDNQRKEREDLEKWIKTNPEILGDDILIIGEQVQTSSGYVDFLGIDKTGNTVIVELKRDKLPREIIAQAIDYASDIVSWDIDRLSEICQSTNNQGLEDFISENFTELNTEDIIINNSQRLLLVGFGIDEPTNRMIEYLSDSYNMSINAVILSYSKTSAGSEIISRTVIIPEEIEKQKANKKKFKIAMSDKLGEYSPEELNSHLKKYLSQPKHSSRRLRDIILPVLLNGETYSRKQLLKELVKSKEAKDNSQAGYFMSLISAQLGHEWRDYLRQIIEYGYPNNPWEKDNFRIREEYVGLVKEVLDEIKR